MQRIKRPSNKKKYLLILALVLVLGGGGYVAYAAMSKTGPFTETPDDRNVNYEAPSSEQVESGEETSNDSKTTPEIDPQKPQPEGTDTPPTPAQDATVSVTITAAEQNGSTLQIRATVNTLTAGTCTLSLSRSGSAIVTKTAPTQPLSSFSTCQGFNIPTSDLAKGEWQLKVDFKNSTHSGSARKTITIN